MTTPEAAPTGTVEAIKAMSIADLQAVRPDLVLVDLLPDQEARESILEEFERLDFKGVQGAALRGIVRESVSDAVQVRFDSTLQAIVDLEGLETADKARAAEALVVAAKGCGVELVVPSFETAAGDEGDGEGDKTKETARESDADVSDDDDAGDGKGDEGDGKGDEGDGKGEDDEGESDVERLEVKLAGRESLTEAITALKVVPDVQVELRRRIRPKVDALILRGAEAIQKATQFEYDALMRVSEAVHPSMEGTGTDGAGDGTEPEGDERKQEAAEANVGLGAAYGAPATRK